jgi:hypothetical protein
VAELFASTAGRQSVESDARLCAYPLASRTMKQESVSSTDHRAGMRRALVQLDNRTRCTTKPWSASADGVSDVARRQMPVMFLDHSGIGVAEVCHSPTVHSRDLRSDRAGRALAGGADHRIEILA